MIDRWNGRVFQPYTLCGNGKVQHNFLGDFSTIIQATETVPSRITQIWRYRRAVTPLYSIHLCSEWHTECPSVYSSSTNPGWLCLVGADAAHQTPSASPLNASTPELRFRTRVWWTRRDARWVQADIAHADGHTYCEWAKWRISRKHTPVVIAKQPQEKVSESVSPF